jgi:hypothetical protein
MANKPPKPSHGTVVAVRVRVTGRAGRDRSTRGGYLAEAQHRMLPACWRHSPTANMICHRGPGQQPEVTTGELTIAIAAVTIARRLEPHPTRQVMQGGSPGLTPERGAVADRRGGSGVAAARDSRAAAYNEKLRALPCSHECFAGAAAEVRSNSSYYYIFLISRYRRASGSDLTASSPSTTAAAARVIIVTYLSVRIISSCYSAGPRQRPATLMSLILEWAVSPAAPPPPDSLPTCSRRTRCLAAVRGNGG